MNINAALLELINIYHENKLAHAYLIETNNVDRCLLELKEVVKEIFKDIQNINTLIDNNTLPSLIIINSSEKTIKKDDIEFLQKSFSLSSMYTDKSIYIIVNPEKMNSSAYNKILKFLEEPEANILGFFITNSKENIASTIISRCEIIKVNYQNILVEEKFKLSKDEYEKYYNTALDYINNIELDNLNIVLYNNSVVLKNYKDRNEVITLLKIVNQIYCNAFHSDNPYPNNFKKLQILSKYLYEGQYNLNINLMLDALTLELGVLND